MVAIIYYVHNTSLDNMKSLLSLREIFNWPLSETWDYIGFIYMWYVHTDLTEENLKKTLANSSTNLMNN